MTTSTSSTRLTSSSSRESNSSSATRTSLVVAPVETSTSSTLDSALSPLSGVAPDTAHLTDTVTAGRSTVTSFLTVVVTSTDPAGQELVSSSTRAVQTTVTSSASDGGPDSLAAGAIAGGVLGGIAFVGLLILLSIFMRKRGWLAPRGRDGDHLNRDLWSPHGQHSSPSTPGDDNGGGGSPGGQPSMSEAYAGATLFVPGPGSTSSSSHHRHEPHSPVMRAVSPPLPPLPMRMSYMPEHDMAHRLSVVPPLQHDLVRRKSQPSMYSSQPSPTRTSWHPAPLSQDGHLGSYPSLPRVASQRSLEPVSDLSRRRSQPNMRPRPPPQVRASWQQGPPPPAHWRPPSREQPLHRAPSQCSCGGAVPSTSYEQLARAMSLHSLEARTPLETRRSYEGDLARARSSSSNAALADTDVVRLSRNSSAGALSSRRLAHHPAATFLGRPPMPTQKWSDNSTSEDDSVFCVTPRKELASLALGRTDSKDSAVVEPSQFLGARVVNL